MERVRPPIRWMTLIFILSLFCLPALAVTTNTTTNTTANTTTTTLVPVTTTATTAPPTTVTLAPVTAKITAVPTTSIEGSGTSWFDIYTNVDGVHISFDGSDQGTTAQGVLTVAWATTGTPPRTVTGTKSGYTSASEPLPAVPPAGHHASVYLTLNPDTPRTGSMGFSSTPKGAEVRINGVYYGTTPHRVDNLPPGTSYQIAIDYPGYQTWTSTEEVGAGKITYVDAVLKPTVRYGTLSASSNPRGAHITIDGAYYGVTPKTIGGLEEGSHMVELTLPGYVEWSGKVRIYPDQVTSLNEPLATVQHPETGALSVASTPASASVSVDGVSYGVTPQNNRLVATGIAAGQHQVVISLAGYEAFSQTVSVAAGGTTTVDAALTKSGTGSVSVESAPSGATIYLNNQDYGITPLTIPDLAPGTYSLRLTLGGYQDSTLTVQVNSGATTPVSAQMVAVPPTTEASASPLLPGVALLCAGLGMALMMRKE